jgi:hypothetical protein
MEDKEALEINNANLDSLFKGHYDTLRVFLIRQIGEGKYSKVFESLGYVKSSTADDRLIEEVEKAFDLWWDFGLPERGKVAKEEYMKELKKRLNIE